VVIYVIYILAKYTKPNQKQKQKKKRILYHDNR